MEKKLQKTSYRVQFIDSARFMASSLSKLVNNLAEGIHKSNVNTEMMIKNVKLVELNTKIANAFLITQTV